VPVAKIGRLPVSYWTQWQTGAIEVYDQAEGGQWSRPPAFPLGGAGLVSTADDYLAFAQMLLNGGVLDGRRILSRPSVELMTTDRLTPAQKAVSGLDPGFFESHGWGFGVAVVTRRDEIWSVPGQYGWSGGLGSVWANDPSEDLVAVLMTQQAWPTSEAPAIVKDFFTLAYQAIDD
jgi:CubicO group peptidase (beta-lactamase class C family)